MVVIHSIPVLADWFSSTGKSLSSANRLLLEVPEYTTFKDGDVLSNKEGDYIFILNTNGKYLTSLYAYINFQGNLYIGDDEDIAANKDHIENFRFATDLEKQKLIDALKESEKPKAKEYLKRFFGIEEKPKYEFKPFDRVLVRNDENEKWHISLFARENMNCSDASTCEYECCSGLIWNHCIPFEGNEHLLETDENSEEGK